MELVGESTYSYIPFYTFTGGADGNAPIAPPAFDGSGNMYVASSGRDHSSGAILMFPKSGTGFGAPTIVHTFYGGDGNDPTAALTYNPATGKMYGFTSFGGPYESGTAYTVTP